MLKNALLWKIETPNRGIPPSYLFGTMHIRDLRAFEQLGAVFKALDACEIFAGEFDFSEIDNQLMEESLKLPPGQTLPELLSARTWKNLQKFAPLALGMPAKHLVHFHPMTLSGMLMASAFNEDAKVSLDETLFQYAVAKGKTTAGVETFLGQIEIINKISMEEHISQLSWILRNYSRRHEQGKKLLEAYQAGDLRKLNQLARREARGLRQILVYDRNILMAERLSELAATSAVFCAVGAGHLAGRTGLLRLLKQKGFRLKAIPMDFEPGTHLTHLNTDPE